METIKVAVEVSVNLSENTQNFIKSLFTGVPHAISAPATATVAKPAEKPVEEKKSDTKKPVEPAQTKQSAEPAPSAPAVPAASSASKTIEDVRRLLAKKVNDNREEIKNKLNELGAPSVTKLNHEKYDEMYEFLNQL